MEKKIKSSISNIGKNDGKNNEVREWFVMIKKNLLLFPGESQISIINILEYKLVKKINIALIGFVEFVKLIKICY